MGSQLHQDFSDPNIVNVCSQKASAAGFSVFGVEASGQCFSGVNAELTFRKHGQAPDGDCLNGEGNNFRMSVYEFSKLILLFFPSFRVDYYYYFSHLFFVYLFIY